MPGHTAAASTIVSTGTAWLLLLSVIALWGANWPVMKVGLDYLPPLTFAAIRMVLGAITMFAVAAPAGQLRLPSRRDRPVVFSVGLMQMAGFLALVTFGLQFVPAGRSAILAYTTSLWVVPLAAIFLRERLDGVKLLGFLLGIGGVAVLFNPFAFDWTDSQVLLGNGLLLLAALLWAILIVQVRGHRMEGSPLSLAPWQFTVAAVVLVPIAIAMEWHEPIRWSGEMAAVVLYNGPLATGFAFWAMITVTRALPAVTTSLATLGVPVCGMLLSALFIDERLTVSNVSGLVLILVGVACVTMADRRARRNGR